MRSAIQFIYDIYGGIIMKIEIPKIIQKVAPRWTEKLTTRTRKQIAKPCIVNGTRLDISHYECCIVGETLDLIELDMPTWWRMKVNLTNAHDGCRTCVKFSKEFNEIIADLKRPRNERLSFFAKTISDEVYKASVDSDRWRLETRLEDYAKHLERSPRHRELLKRKSAI